MNMRIWRIGTLNQLIIRGSYDEIKFSKILHSGKFKISSDSHIKIHRSRKPRAILKIPRGIQGLSAGFKIKPLRRSFFLCLYKNQLTFCRKIC